MATGDDPTERPAASSQADGIQLDRENVLRALYEAFNARDTERVLGHMTAGVDWPNAWEGGRVHGHQAIRDYWTRQWAAISPTVEPTGFVTRPDATIAVEVTQVVRGLDGSLLSEGHVVHVYAFDHDLVTRMDVEETGGAH